MIYYDVTLTNKKTNSKVSYLANSFEVTDDRILKIYSVEFGNVFVKIEIDERLTVGEIRG